MGKQHKHKRARITRTAQATHAVQNTLASTPSTNTRVTRNTSARTAFISSRWRSYIRNHARALGCIHSITVLGAPTPAFTHTLPHHGFNWGEELEIRRRSVLHWKLGEL